MSKQLKALWSKNPTKISDAFVDIDGVWVYLCAGWCRDFASHIIHTDTVKEALAEFQDIGPCDCEQCQGGSRA